LQPRQSDGAGNSPTNCLTGIHTFTAFRSFPHEKVNQKAEYKNQQSDAAYHHEKHSASSSQDSDSTLGPIPSRDFRYTGF
jgi:hypothetical protein